MAEKTILAVLVDGRKNSAVTAQKVLTEWGCLIKTRLGIHDGVLDNCSESGLIILELVGDKTKKELLVKKLNIIPGVSTKLVELCTGKESKECCAAPEKKVCAKMPEKKTVPEKKAVPVKKVVPVKKAVPAKKR